MSATQEPPRVKILAEADPQVHRIFPDLAKDIGLDESIFLMQIAFWLKTGGEFIDGRWWTYQSVRDMEEKAFKYWSISTINRIAKRLIDAGYLLEGNYNKKKYDRTRWFALNIDKLQELNSITIMIGDIKLVQSEPRKTHYETQSAQDATRQNQNETTIPESLTESLTEIKDKESSALRSEDAPIILGTDSDSHNPVQSPEFAAPLEEAPVIQATEESASQAQAPESSEVSPALEAEQLDPDPIAPEEASDAEVAGVIEEAEELVKTNARYLNDCYQEVVRRALGKPNEPLNPGKLVGRYIKIFKGTYVKGEYGAGKDTLEYQLSDEPMSPAEIAGFALCCRKEWSLEAVPQTLDTFRRRVDQFRALPGHAKWVAEGQKRLDQIMTGASEAKPVSRVANAQKPPDESDMKEVDWDAEDRKHKESLREREQTNIPA